MELRITRENIEQYRSTIREDVTSINWRAGNLDGQVLANFPNLTKLNCSSNKLTSLTGLKKCIRLRRLNCSNNRLTSLMGIENCDQLLEIDCYHNKLTSLMGIKNCTLLQRLDCSYNKLTSLTGIEKCTQLQGLFCNNNQLTSLTGIEKCTQLQGLFCNSNQLTSLIEIENYTHLCVLNCNNNQLISLAGIENCTQLQEFNCSHNKLTLLTGIENCTQLREFNCYNNQLTHISQIVYLRRLEYLNYSNNPLAIQNIQVQRFLDRIQTNRNSSVYDDNQNVHNSTIQKTVCESIQNLLKDPKPDFNIQTIIDSDLKQKIKEQLIEYCEDTTVHSVHLLTYFDLLSYVWSRIIRSEHSNELMKILEEQICDSECKCFTGRFNRTLSILVGFFDDIKIEISDNDRISAIVLAIRDQYSDKSVDEQRKLIVKALEEAGYDEETTRPWIDVLDEL